MGNTVQSANPKATANQCQHEEGSLVEQTRVSFFFFFAVNAKVSIISQWHPMGFAFQDGAL